MGRYRPFHGGHKALPVEGIKRFGPVRVRKKVPRHRPARATAHGRSRGFIPRAVPATLFGTRKFVVRETNYIFPNPAIKPP